jgi:iron(III) transport system ATP-binding protein
VLESVGLGAFENRLAPQLSGGQQQRVALARALVKAPEVLLLDEPLSNLDAKLRERMRQEIADLLRKFQITSVYVTHDQAEALSISDHVVVMSDGRIVEEGSPKELYLRPRTPFVADFVGLSNLLEGKLLSTDERGLAQADFNGLKVCVETDGASGRDALRISIRPENIHLSKNPLALPNCWQGKVQSATFLGELVDYQLEVSGQILRSRVHPVFEAKVGESVYVGLDPKDCVVVSSED